MDSIIEMLLTGLVDPFIWIKSMSLLGSNKSKRTRFGAFLGYYILLIGRELLAGYTMSAMVKITMTIVLVVYILIATEMLVKGKLSEKIIGLFIFLCSELIVLEVYVTLTHGTFYRPVDAKILYYGCCMFVKLFQFGLCYWIYKDKNRGILFGKIKETIAIGIVIASIISSMLMADADRNQSGKGLLIFQLIEILFIWYLVSSLVEFRKKEKSILLLNKEVDGMAGQQEYVRDVDRFRHDYASNAFVLKNLWNYKEYDKLGKYMEKVFADAEKVAIVFEHPNFAIQIIISNLMKIAKKIDIPFSAEMSVKVFHMKEEDICSILHNLVLNALRDSVQTRRSKVHVFLQVSLVENQYEMQCINEFLAVDGFTGTFLQEKEEENLEFFIVKEIVKRYNGFMDRNCIKMDKKRLWKEVVRIRIPVQQKIPINER